MARTASPSSTARGALLVLMACATTNTSIRAFTPTATASTRFGMRRGDDVTIPSALVDVETPRSGTSLRSALVMEAAAPAYAAVAAVPGASAARGADSRAAANSCWEFRVADDLDVPVMTDLIEQKCQFDRDLSGRPPITMKPATGDTLTSLFPELPTGQVLLIHERQQLESGDRTRWGGTGTGSAASTDLTPPIVGFAMYALRYYGFDRSVPPSMWLHALFVEPDQRSNGAGKALMDEIASLSHQKRCSHVGWKCHVDNVKGQKFYDRMGASIESQKGDLYSYSWVPESWAATAGGVAS